MLAVQENCGKRYKCTISAFEAGLGFNETVLCILKLFLGNRSIFHSGFNLNWFSETTNRKHMQVLIAV